MKTTPLIHSVIAVFFLLQFLCCPLQADELVLPKPGVLLDISPAYQPPVLKGIKINPQNPLRFEFILLPGGHATLKPTPEETKKLVSYFLAGLTVPDKDLWVNLSPYEKDRIIPDAFGRTDMGRDLLAEDYILKQITASLVYPETALGREFWKRVYAASSGKLDGVKIAINTFNKVWIVPDKAVVYENAKRSTAYVLESRLKVLTEADYLANAKNNVADNGQNKALKEIIIPVLNQEINEGKNFSQLRQVYHSLILAAWYKKKIKDGILNQVYADKNKVNGITISNAQEKQKIYTRYLEAFKKGVYNYIKDEEDPVTQQIIPRKYFSGGVNVTDLAQMTLKTTRQINQPQWHVTALRAVVDLAMIQSDDYYFENRDSINAQLKQIHLKNQPVTLEQVSKIAAKHAVNLRSIIEEKFGVLLDEYFEDLTKMEGKRLRKEFSPYAVMIQSALNDGLVNAARPALITGLSRKYILKGQYSNGDFYRAFQDMIFMTIDVEAIDWEAVEKEVEGMRGHDDEADLAMTDANVVEGIATREAYTFLTEPELRPLEYLEVLLGRRHDVQMDPQGDMNRFIPEAWQRVQGQPLNGTSYSLFSAVLRNKINEVARDGLAANSFASAQDIEQERVRGLMHRNHQVHHEIIVPKELWGQVPQGFMSFREYIDAIAFHPQWGYYTSGRVTIGERKDFKTEVESLSPYFGKRMAEHAFGMWQNMGKMAHFDAVEFGAGNGTLARDFLGYARHQARTDADWRLFYESLHYTIAEISPGLRARQQALLEAFGSKVVVKAVDARNITASIPPGSINGFIFSNELLDDIPPYKVLIDKDGQFNTAFVAPRFNKAALRSWADFMKGVTDHDPLSPAYVGERIDEYRSLIQAIAQGDEVMRSQFRLRQHADDVYLSKALFVKLMTFFHKISHDPYFAAWQLYSKMVGGFDFEEIYTAVDPVSELGQYLKEYGPMYQSIGASERRRKDAVIYVAPDEVKFIKGINQVLNTGYHLLIDYGARIKTLEDNMRITDLRLFPIPPTMEDKNPYFEISIHNVTRDVNFSHLEGPGLDLNTLFFGQQGALFAPSFKNRTDLDADHTRARDKFYGTDAFNMMFQQKAGTPGKVYNPFRANPAMNTEGVQDWIFNGQVGDIQPAVQVYKDVLKGHREAKEIVGLKNKVVIKLKDGRVILVADDHQHAFSFWWLMMRQGILPDKGNHIFHIDAHADATLVSKYLPRDGTAFGSTDRFADIMNLSNRFGIEGFIAPLFLRGFFVSWYWLFNLESNMAAAIEESAGKYVINAKRLPSKEVDFDVLDIDLDVFNQGASEDMVERNLDDFTDLARKAKVISIVTSPGFIDQEKSIMYARKLVEKIMATEKSTGREGGINFNSDKLNIETKFGADTVDAIKLNVDPAMLKRLQESSGFTPTIINIEPIQDMQIFLGVNDQDTRSS